MDSRQVKIDLRVKTVGNLESTVGMMVRQEYLDNRRPNMEGTIKNWVMGHGGDVWWVIHENGAIAPYVFTEFDPV